MTSELSVGSAPNITRGVGDVETYPNFFCISFVDYVSDHEVTFEISERKNDLGSLVSCIRSLQYFISFNGQHYDNLMVQYLNANYNRLIATNPGSINKELKVLNDLIINADENDRTTYNAFERYTRNQPWQTIDLFLYWSKLTRISRKLSLKSMAVNMNWPRIQELPYGPDHIVELHEMDAIIDYNLNDCRITKELAVRMKKDINLRMDAKKRYGFNCLSWDGVKLGYNILLKRYSDRIGAEISNVRALRTVRTQVDIGALILPVIAFKEASTTKRQYIEDKSLITEFTSFYGLHMYLKGLTVKTTKEISCRVMYKGNRYDVKSGGLHTYHNSEVKDPGKLLYRDIDVSSYYPTFGGKWQAIPEHLGIEFAEELESVRQERIKLKANGQGKSNDAELLKLAMNGGFYGNTNNEHTAMQDMRCMLNITINGQLLLLMLCEQLIDIGATIDMCNTDGVTILFPEAIKDAVEKVCSDWEVLSRMELERITYLKVVRMNINNYIALYDDKGTTKAKLKGLFLTEPPVDMSRDALVISKALYAHYVEGKDIEQFIRSHNNIYDFCICQKVSKQHFVTWNGKAQQRLNRYFVTNSGPYLYKVKDGVSSHMMKDRSVQLFNDYYKASMEKYNINYNYYVSEAKKLINQLEPQQLSMF